MKTKNKLILTAALGFFSFTANAGLITYSNFQHEGSDAVDYIVTIADDSESGVTAGNFKISYQVDLLSTYTTAKLTGFFFDVAAPFVANNSPYNSGNLGLANETTPVSCAQGFNTHQITGSCGTNLNLGAGAGLYAGHEFDVAIAWNNGNDLSTGAIGMFEVSDLDGALTLADWAAVGLRGQATCLEGSTDCNGSAKEFQIMANTVVPVPAAVWLFGSGLVGLIGFARRKKA